MQKICFNLPSLEDCEISIICHPENTPIKGNAIASCDDKYDKQVEDLIKQSVINGNIWAWCCVEVILTYKGLSESDFLGCCSYLDEEDFKNNSGYLSDMANNAFERLIERLKEFAD